jgi:hypothetical protein
VPSTTQAVVDREVCLYVDQLVVVTLNVGTLVVHEVVHAVVVLLDVFFATVYSLDQLVVVDRLVVRDVVQLVVVLWLVDRLVNVWKRALVCQVVVVELLVLQVVVYVVVVL